MTLWAVFTMVTATAGMPIVLVAQSHGGKYKNRGDISLLKLTLYE